MNNVGIDIIEISRMKKKVLKKNFIERYLSTEEINEFNNLESKYLKIKYLTNIWALKEAIYKALPHEHLAFNEINITKNEHGQPTVVIKNYQIKLSLSHNTTNVIAIAIIF